MEKTKIALVQMESVLGNSSENLDRSYQYIRTASSNAANIICFPEASIHGYSKSLGQKKNMPIVEIISQLQLWADQFQISILAGVAEPNKTTSGQKPYITQLIIQPQRDVGVYRKTHLGESEKPFFSEGSDLPVFSTSTAKIGIQICWDLHFPEVTTILSLQGADIIFAPHASPTIVGDRKKIWMKYLPARAYDNAVFLATCNLIGSNGNGQRFCGGAMVFDPKGNLVAEDFGGHEGILYADLDADLLRRIRHEKTASMKDSFYLSLRRPDLYQKYSKFLLSQ